MSWLHFSFAIVCGIAATAALHVSSMFAEIRPLVLAIAGYAISFCSLWFALQEAPGDIVRAAWSGAGIVFVMAVTWGCIRSKSKRRT